MIKPTIGRVVWFHPVAGDTLSSSDQALAAIVAYVHSDSMVNLAVFDGSGNSFSRTSVSLVQEGDAVPSRGGYCEWMPYQKGQAAKTEALEARLPIGERPSDKA